jgi:hypothetical protein
MSFVDVFSVHGEPEPEPPEVFERPEWMGPPENELGVAVALGLILGRAEKGVIGLSHALVHSTGVSLELHAVARGLRASEAGRLFHEQHLQDPTEELPDGFLRFGVEFGGGARASNLGGRLMRRSWETEPDGPVLMQHGGGSGMSNPHEVTMRPAFWLWPLPDPGTLTISCEWPVVGIGLTTTAVDADALRSAAEQVVPLWAS